MGRANPNPDPLWMQRTAVQSARALRRRRSEPQPHGNTRESGQPTAPTEDRGTVRDRWRGRLRALDQRLKAVIYAALGALVRPSGPQAVPDWTARPHRVLYLRYDRVGDMMLATGIIKAIVSAQPTVAVDVLASTRNAAVLRGNPSVGNVFTIDKARPWSYLTAVLRVRRMRYDAVVDAMVMTRSLTAMLLMWASGARHRIGVAGRGNDFALTLPVPRVRHAIHYVDHSAAVLAAFGVDPDQKALERGCAAHGQVWRPEVFLTPTELSDGEARWRSMTSKSAEPHAPRRRLLANVSAGAGWRYWPEDRFITTLKRIRQRFPDLSILVIGSPQDRERMVRIGRGVGAPVAFTPQYRQMMAIVAASDFVFTADTSVTHVASAFSKPVVVMFSGGGAPLYGPYGTLGRTVSTLGPTLESLEVEPVARELQAVIEAARSPDR